MYCKSGMLVRVFSISHETRDPEGRPTRPKLVDPNGVESIKPLEKIGPCDHADLMGLGP